MKDFYEHFESLPEPVRKEILARLRRILTWRGHMPDGLATVMVAGEVNEIAALFAKHGMEIEELT